MCGIVGIASVGPNIDRAWLNVGRDSMSHRGPDDFGEWWNPNYSVGFGHRRLSIIDLSESGTQPMLMPSHNVAIVFNGEIYNYQELKSELRGHGFSFNSSGDTEVLLAAYAHWGNKFLLKVNGMFAFAIFDGNANKVILGRDRAGEKPLYYRLEMGRLQFASELKGLLANPNNPRRVDYEALDCLMMMGFVPGDRCILEGYNKLPPAHALEFSLSNGCVRQWRYWSAPDFGSSTDFKVDRDLLSELEYLLEDAVKKQMVADVPVGVLLSGGVDSSLLTAMAVRSSSNVRTFTVGFPGHGAFDETKHARLIANHFGTTHTELQATEPTVDLIPELARQFDEPIIDSSMIPTALVSRLVREHCTVAIGGDGGDELFGGYHHHSRLLWMKKNLGWLPNGVGKSIANLSERLLPIGFKGRNWLKGLDRDLATDLPLIATYFDHKSRGSLLPRILGVASYAEMIRSKRIPRQMDLLQRATRMDFENYLPEDILVKVDRASMMASLEVRAPFLDLNLMEFAFAAVPSKLKASTTEKKIVLKSLARKLLPPQFDTQRKQGFSVPMRKWLQHGAFRDFFYDTLLDPRTCFDRAAVADLFAGQVKGRSNSERLFALLMIELWRREYQIEI